VKNCVATEEWIRSKLVSSLVIHKRMSWQVNSVGRNRTERDVCRKISASEETSRKRSVASRKQAPFTPNALIRVGMSNQGRGGGSPASGPALDPSPVIPSDLSFGYLSAELKSPVKTPIPS
jgi:hypothetical protein